MFVFLILFSHYDNKVPHTIFVSAWLPKSNILPGIVKFLGNWNETHEWCHALTEPCIKYPITVFSDMQICKNNTHKCATSSLWISKCKKTSSCHFSCMQSCTDIKRLSNIFTDMHIYMKDQTLLTLVPVKWAKTMKIMNGNNLFWQR